ncbi:hypothetical protein PUMCH_003418 [Australozyma saopauloensis]|uniref:Actin cytoskeleton-regulatory complex protein SLA1 n=1 Tax=Australozyma saopauloensis TaxID=291208 RepID=A0AAX4HC15_9ASCO|nr:hypothetical protein PUMCH_003418 [[Candida] saopauloensis]
MASLFIGIYRALYDYTARDELELSIQENDLLYLLEKSDIDEWWTVKKRLPLEAGADVEEPSGIVPSNYIGPAEIIHTAHALYDYDKQTQEELSFAEGAKFNVYDTSDPDWLLVGLADGSQYGYVPGNYIERDSASGAPAAAQVPAASAATAAITMQPISAFAAPPQHKSRAVSEEPKPAPSQEEALDVDGDTPRRNLPPTSNAHDESDEEEAPPPMPARPNEPKAAARPDPPKTASALEPEHRVDDDYFRWFISELHRDKKTPVELAVSSREIIFKRDKDTKLKRGEEQEYSWPIGRLTNYNHEKKHLFLDFENPTKSLHLYTGDKLVSEAIISILGEFKGAYEAAGLREVARAASLRAPKNKTNGTILYRFKAQGSNELLAKEGDKVVVHDANDNKDWWLCENLSSKKKGYIPASYVELETSKKLRLFRERSDRDKIRENDRVKRGKQKHAESEENMPNFHRVRTWIDASGTFKVEAELLGFKEGKIHLHKTNGVKIAVAAAKLSMEDLEYVEKVSEVSLQDYKDEVARQMAKKAKRQTSSSNAPAPSVPSKDSNDRTGVVKNKSATALINDMSPSKDSTPTRSSATIPQTEPDYDWFEFFLNCGVDIGNCQRYSVVFGKEQMDESILEDITPTLLRSLGLREGDILRVTKHLDEKFDRKKTEVVDSSHSGSGLFTGPAGELKNNSTVETTKVNASALPSSTIKSTPEQSKIEDDAWAVKPAARSSEDLSKPVARPQYTGSLHDLIDIKPLEANKDLTTPQRPAPTNSTAPSLQPLEPTKTAPSLPQTPQTPQAPQVGTQKTGQSAPQQPLMVMRTGGLVPVNGAGLIPVQPTGFMPIGAQPTGFVPIQATGGLIPQGTSFGIIPLQTGATTFTAQKTGPPIPSIPPPTTFGQSFQPTGTFVPLQTGNITGVSMYPQTTFGQPPAQPMASFVPLQATGVSSAPPMMPATTFGQVPIGGQATGGAMPAMGSQVTGQILSNAFVPQSTFGKQITGGFMGANRTGGAQMPPQTSFSAQLTGGIPPMQTTFTNQATGQSMPSMPTFGSGPDQAQSLGMAQMTNMFQSTSLGNNFGQQQQGQQAFGQQQMPQATFGQQPTQSFGQQMQPQSYGQATFGQQQPSQPQFGQPQFGQPQFGQPQFGQPQFGESQFGQPNAGQPWQQPMAQNSVPTTSFGQPAVQPTSFGQTPAFDGFQNTPLQSQPTGLGFGNAPGLQSQQTGRRANLQSATADNPFGF